MLPALRLPLLLALLVWLAAPLGCAPGMQFAKPPVHKADLYPTAHHVGGLVVAVDPMLDARRSVDYFGFDPRTYGVMPAQLIVTNHGTRPVSVAAEDVLVSRDRTVIDPMPIEHVAAIRKLEEGWMTGRGAKKVDEFFASMSFHDSVIAPGETLRGFLFFELEPQEEKDDGDEGFSLAAFYPDPTASLRLVVTDTEQGRRILFGPFPLAR